MIELTLVPPPSPASNIRGLIRRQPSIRPGHRDFVAGVHDRPLMMGDDDETLGCGLCGNVLAVGVDPTRLQGVVFECPLCARCNALEEA